VLSRAPQHARGATKTQGRNHSTWTGLDIGLRLYTRYPSTFVRSSFGDYGRNSSIRLYV